MSVSLDQLRAALAASGSAPAVPVTDRMPGIRRRVAARRRRRAGGYAAGVAAVAIVAVLASTSVVGQRHAERPAAPANPLINGLPLYAYGARQIGSAQIALKAGVTHLFTTTPSSYGLILSFGCTGAKSITLRVNGRDSLSGDCGAAAGESVSGFGGYTPAAQQRHWSFEGVRVGHPVNVDLVVPAGERVSGNVRAAFYQQVPFADYPLPPRPARVELDGDPNVGLGLTQTRDVVLPGRAATGSWSISLPYDARLVLGGITTGPGKVEVHVAGRLVGGSSSWTYSPSGLGVTIDPESLRLAGLAVPPTGAPTTITVTVTGFAERTWRLQLGLSRRSLAPTG